MGELFASVSRAQVKASRSGIQGSRYSLTDIGFIVDERSGVFGGIPGSVNRFFSLSLDADLSLGMGLECVGLRWGVAGSDGNCRRPVSISDRQTVFPKHPCRISKGSRMAEDHQ